MWFTACWILKLKLQYRVCSLIHCREPQRLWMMSIPIVIGALESTLKWVLKAESGRRGRGAEISNGGQVWEFSSRIFEVSKGSKASPCKNNRSGRCRRWEGVEIRHNKIWKHTVKLNLLAVAGRNFKSEGIRREVWVVVMCEGESRAGSSLRVEFWHALTGWALSPAQVFCRSGSRVTFLPSNPRPAQSQPSPSAFLNPQWTRLQGTNRWSLCCMSCYPSLAAHTSTNRAPLLVSKS